MWYFAWILGVGFACILAVLNGIWFESKGSDCRKNSENLI